MSKNFCGLFRYFSKLQITGLQPIVSGFARPGYKLPAGNAYLMQILR